MYHHTWLVPQFWLPNFRRKSDHLSMSRKVTQNMKIQKIYNKSLTYRCLKLNKLKTLCQWFWGFVCLAFFFGAVNWTQGPVNIKHVLYNLRQKSTSWWLSYGNMMGQNFCVAIITKGSIFNSTLEFLTFLEIRSHRIHYIAQADHTLEILLSKSFMGWITDIYHHAWDPQIRPF